MTTQDYIYCYDCDMFVDFWKYDHNHEAAGHSLCTTRFVTEGELEDLVHDCIENGCLERNEADDLCASV